MQSERWSSFIQSLFVQGEIRGVQKEKKEDTDTMQTNQRGFNTDVILKTHVRYYFQGISLACSWIKQRTGKLFFSPCQFKVAHIGPAYQLYKPVVQMN